MEWICLKKRQMQVKKQACGFQLSLEDLSCIAISSISFTVMSRKAIGRGI